MDNTALFTAVREILIARTGTGLTQAEVDKINRALAQTIVTDLAPSGKGKGMGASGKALAFIHSFEKCVLTAYKDPGSKDGLPITCGWGSTTDLQGNPIKYGAVWTQQYADAKFAQDVAKFEMGLNALLQGKPTTQAQFDALFSFAYNVGLDIDEDTKAEGLGDSTLLRKHLLGDYAGAQQSFAAWKYNDGKVMNGLIRRRAAEAAMYGGTYP
jgi:lysozyme